jgi:hypothetical protein
MLFKLALKGAASLPIGFPKEIFLEQVTEPHDGINKD